MLQISMITNEEAAVWKQAVLEMARHAIAGFDEHKRIADFIDTGGSAFKNRSFWLGTPAVPAGFKSNYYDAGEIKRSFFVQTTNFKERYDFAHNQQGAIKNMNADILAIENNPSDSLHNIQEDRLLDSYETGKAKRAALPMVLLPYVYKNRDIFDANPALHFITRLPELAWQTVNEKEFVKTMNDLGLALSGRFRNEYGVDLRGGQIATMISELNVLNTYDLVGFIKHRRDNSAKPLPVKMVKAKDIKPVSDAAVDFMEVTTRPGRGDRCETGGKAGLGSQKPDLWKPQR